MRERRPHVDPGPLGPHRGGVEAPLPRQRRERPAQGKRGRGKNHGPFTKQVFGQHLTDLERRDVQGGRAGRLCRPVLRPLEPDDLLPLRDRLLERGEHPLGHLADLLQVDQRGLRRGDLGRVGVVALGHGQLAHLHGARHRGLPERGQRGAKSGVEVVHPAGRHGDEQRAEGVARLGQPRDLPLVGQLAGPADRELDRLRRELAAGDRGDPVHQLVRLVDDDDPVLGQDAALAERVDGEQRVVGDDDVGLGRGPPGALGEALDAERAAVDAQALARRHRDLPPGLVRDAGDELVAVAGGGRRGPLVQPLHVRAERAGGRVEERVLLVLGAVAQLVQAEVVVPALEYRELRPAAERPAQRVDQPGQVALDQLALQRDGGGGDHDRAVLLGRGQLQRGHQVGQRLAGPGAGLHGQVRAAGHRVPDGPRHLALTVPLGAADRGDGGGQQRENVRGGRLWRAVGGAVR